MQKPIVLVGGLVVAVDPLQRVLVDVAALGGDAPVHRGRREAGHRIGRGRVRVRTDRRRVAPANPVRVDGVDRRELGADALDGFRPREGDDDGLEVGE